MLSAFVIMKVGARGSVVVEAVRYKPEGHAFQAGEVYDFSGRTRPWGLLSP
jgi:hypothetical protein